MKTRNNKETRISIALTVAATVFCLLPGSALAKKPAPASVFEPDPAKLEALGKAVFFDTSLSTPGNKQGCVSCHEPSVGWTFPDSEVNATQVGNPGASPHATGHIKPPAVSYAAFVPQFHSGCRFGAPAGGRHCGGLFWDGRAEGWGLLASDDTIDPPVLGPLGDGVVSETVTKYDLPDAVAEAYMVFLGPLADQALNPAQKGIEQNAGEKKICQQVKTAKYKALYEHAFGEPIDCRSSAYNTSFKRIAVAVAAYEASDEVSPFNSKRDIALYKELACLNFQAFEGYEFDPDYCALEESVNYGRFPLAGLTDQENQGHDLFYAVTSDLNPTGKDAGCRFCHNDNPTPFNFRGPQVPGTNLDGTEPRQLYTDNAYHNIGIPYNREIPDTPKGSVVGVSGHLTSASPGFFRDPSIRNVGLGEGEDFVKAYGHNGYFKSLWQIVHFYSTRDLKTRCEELPEPILDATVQEALDNDCWPEPEFSNPGNFGLVGIADLTTEQEEAIVAYLKTLSDTTVAEAP